MRFLSLLPQCVQLWVQRLLPEWFLPSEIVLKCQKKATDVEHGDEVEFENLFESEYKAYKRLKPIQGLLVPTCYETTKYRDRNALILERLPGPTLAEPDGATLTLHGAKDLLEKCYKETVRLGAVQEEPNLSNFILSPCRKHIMAVDLEYVSLDHTAELFEFRTVSCIQSILENYTGRQQFLRNDGFLKAA